MRKILLFIIGGIFSIYDSSGQTASYSVIPSPQLVKTTGQDSFHLKKNTTITYPKGNELLKRNAEFLSEYIGQATGNAPAIHTYIKEKRANNAIILALDPTIKNKEGYILVTTSRGIRISGQTANGVFYGIQTLRKTIPATVTTDILLPAGEIKDEPRFSYRGMHLDVCRHFYPVEFVKRYIDLLALHNMNTFHWHLTEDQGWRIEIKKFPKLTEVGSIRNKTVIGKAGSGKYDNTPYGGFYTQEQAKDIVKYAQERFITVIPEIDLPGHMLAALAAYPELGCTGGPYEVCPDWGIFDDVLCIGNDKTLPFLEVILAEIIEIFPSKYIHIGGDEAPRTRWKECSKCQARIKNEGLKADKEHTAEDRLQTFCMTHIEKFLNGKGRQIIGWEEILKGDVAPNATVMSWRGIQSGIKAAQMGHDVIMVPKDHCYFDYYQVKDTKQEPLAIGGFVPVENVYNLNPVPTELTAEQQKHILGAQANLWSEYIPTSQQVEYMVLPRMAALSEALWTEPQSKSYENFLQRLPWLVKLYQRDGFNYAKHVLP